MQTAKVGDTAQWISKVDGTPHLGDVIEAEETYADVQWRQNGRVERIQFSHPDGVTFEHVIHHVSECTRPYDWSGEHLFEDDQIELNPEGYDEYERCGLPADDPLHVEGAHAAALNEWGLPAQEMCGCHLPPRPVNWHADPTLLCLRAGDHWPHMTAVSPDCRTLPTDQQ